MKLPKDFGRIKMEEEMLRQDAKRRMALWRERRMTQWDGDDETHITTKDYVAMRIGVIVFIGAIAWMVIG